MDWSGVLFVGWGDDAGVTHYRTKLPARVLGAEWVSILMSGEPHSGEGDRVDHGVVVVQSCWEPWQLRAVQRMRAGGAVVVANVDDWLPAVANLSGSGAHAFASSFVGRRERTFLDFLSLCDGAVTSTEWLRGKLQGVMPGKLVVTARNGLDLERYDVWRGRSARSGVGSRLVVGWAGGTGHGQALMDVLPDVWSVLRRHRDVMFVAVGDDVAVRLAPEDLRGRVLRVPWADMALYPLNLDLLDVMIAPTRLDDFYRGKSQLRFYEGAAMGKCVVASDHYSEVEHGRTGLVVPVGKSFAPLLELAVSKPELREQLGVNAREWVERSGTIESRSVEWKRAISTILSRQSQDSSNCTR